MPRTSKLILVCLCLVASLGALLPAAAVAPFGLTLSGPSTYYPQRPLSGPFTGVLSLAGVGVPNQTIELRLDGAPVATAATTTQGTYTMSLPPITGTADHVLTAVAFGGTPLETVATAPLLVQRFTLTASLTGTGGGIVESSPAAISCPETCEAEIPATTQIVLDIAPARGSIFSGWTGDCAGTGTCTLDMVADRTVVAQFDFPARLAISPQSHTFPQTVVGQPSSPRTFVVTNTGGLPTGSPVVALTGPDAAHFAILSNTCTSAIAPSGGCTVDVRFAPSSAGAKNASLTVSGTPGGTVVAALSGIAVTPAQLTVSPPFWYPSAGYNQQRFQDFTVTNVGQLISGPLSVNLTGDLSAFVILSNSCSGFALGPAQSCTISLRYTQTLLFGGSHSANLAVNAAPGGTLNVFLSGT